MSTAYPRMGQHDWAERGSISTAGSLLTTDKSATTAHALTATTFVRLQIPQGTIAFNIRWRGGSDGDSNVHTLYAMRGKSDHYTRIATFTLTTGTQTDGTYLFVDTVTKANEKWTDTIEVVSDAANGVAHVVLNTHGYTDFLLLGTVVASTLFVDIARE